MILITFFQDVISCFFVRVEEEKEDERPVPHSSGQSVDQVQRHALPRQTTREGATHRGAG